MTKPQNIEMLKPKHRQTNNNKSAETSLQAQSGKISSKKLCVTIRKHAQSEDTGSNNQMKEN